MSEVDARPAPTRGRSSYRGGRGGFGRGGPRAGGRKPTNGTTNDVAQEEPSIEEQGELGEMKKKYSSELSLLKDMFPDWTDVDLVFALQEADGDVPSTVEKITQGNVSQFAEVKSAKDRARSKVKEASTASAATEKSATRGGRSRGGAEASRGARGRGSERGRGGSRGGRGGHATTNGGPKESGTTSVPTTESSAWDDTTNAGSGDGPLDAAGAVSSKESAAPSLPSWDGAAGAETATAASSETPATSAGKKTWASMLAPKPAPAPVIAKRAAVAPQATTEAIASGQIPSPQHDLTSAESAASAPTVQNALSEPVAASADPAQILRAPSITDGEELSITPSNVPLTEENVEHLPDESHPPATQTVASTAGSVDPRNLTPLPNFQAPIGRPPVGGYATSAYRATGMPGRSASFQRRVQEQQEAVVMPGHNAVDRAAVQFGSMGLNAEPGLDVDEDREEPETRHAPQHSPPSQVRTSLPPSVPRQGNSQQGTSIPEIMSTPKQAPGLPPASQQNQQQMQEAAAAPGISNEHSQVLQQSYNQYGRYGQQGAQQDTSAPQQPKPYDAFGHQAQPSQYDQYGTPAHQAPHQQQQQQNQSAFGALSSAPNDYSSYYTSDQQRNAYNQYYGSGYGPQDLRGQAASHAQDVGMGPQRSASGFGAGPNDSAFPSQGQQHGQSRFGDSGGSGHTTPNPPIGGQNHGGSNAQQSQPSMHQAQGHQQPGGFGGAGSGFPYGHPYYSSPYQQAYQNQFGYSHQLGGYGGGYPAKQSNMYGASHGYNLGPQASYEQHSASPANAGSYGQNQRNVGGVSTGLGGLDDYGRGSAQPAAHQQSTGFGGATDPFARSPSGYGGQGGYGQQSNAEDSLKGYSENKSGTPALGQPGRPGSAANSAGGSGQSALPPSQNQQSGFGGGYGGYQGQSQYGSLGGLGGQQQPQPQSQPQQQHGQQNTMGGQGGYGSYGSGGFGQTYGSYGRGGGGGGWATNYNH